MRLSECVEAAAVMLQLDGGEGLDEATTELLRRCANFVLSEIAAEYLPLKKTERTAAERGVIVYEKLSEKIVDLIGIKRGGKSARARRFPRHTEVDFEGECEVTYSYAPSEVPLGGEAGLWGERVGARTLAYGIACEYCIATGRTDDAVLWDRRYKDSLAAAARGVGEKKTRPRKWYL